MIDTVYQLKHRSIILTFSEIFFLTIHMHFTMFLLKFPLLSSFARQRRRSDMNRASKLRLTVDIVAKFDPSGNDMVLETLQRLRRAIKVNKILQVPALLSVH